MTASSENQQHHPNPAHPSLSAGDHKDARLHAAQNASRPSLQHDPYLTPYLGLRARLSQTWINRWTVLLLLVLIRTLFAIASLDDDLATAKKQALTACTSVENVGSAMASMPHYMSAGLNDLTAHGIERAINGLMQMLILSITVVEELVLFVINMLTGTYLCLITLAVSGSLHVAVSVAEDVGSFLNATVQDVGKDLGTAANEFQSAMNGFLSGIPDASSFLTGGQSSPPTIDLTGDISKLDSLHLPSGYDQGLEKLNSSIPDFAQVRNFTNYAISFPFEEIKKLLNESLPKYTMTGDLFPVPAKQQLQFCSDNNGITDFFDDLVRIEQLAKKIFLAVIILASILAMIPMGYREVRQYRFSKRRAQTLSTDSRDPMDSVYLVSRPYTSSAGLWFSERFKSSRHATLVRWVTAYATTAPALFVLSLALAGLLGSLCQYILLKTIQKEVPVLENQVVDFADKVVYQLNNASEQWAIGTNAIIAQKNATINEDVFGWVVTSTTAINNTLNVFVNEMTTALNDTFGGTILYDPIKEVFNCLIGLKIAAVERGLTWVHDHAHIDFPLLPNNTFSLGAMDQVSGSDVGLLSSDPNNGAANDISDAIYHVTAMLEKAVRQEAIISLCLLLIWFLIALIGIVRALSLWFKSNGSSSHSDIDKTSWLEPAPREVHELKHVALTQVPTYEQATRDPNMSDNHAGNKSHGQAYTLTPAPLPRFTVNHATSPILSTGFSAPPEKLGNVRNTNVDSAIRRPTHIRASSHGDYAITSPSTLTTANKAPRSTNKRPNSPVHPTDPFADPDC